VTGNGTTGYGNTHLNPFTIPSFDDNMHIGAYSRTNLSSGAKAAMGAEVTSAPANVTYMFPRNAGGQTIGAVQYGSFTGFGVITDSLGLTVLNRRTSTHVRRTKNGAANEVAQVATVAPTNRELFVLATNADWAGGATQFDNRNYATFSIGYGLTDQNEQDLYTLVQAFQTALARNV